jgi:hypothetical protein
MQISTSAACAPFLPARNGQRGTADRNAPEMAGLLTGHRRSALPASMKDKQNAPKWPGYSRTIHYEINGSSRIDYQFTPTATEGDLFRPDLSRFPE